MRTNRTRPIVVPKGSEYSHTWVREIERSTGVSKRGRQQSSTYEALFYPASRIVTAFTLGCRQRRRDKRDTLASQGNSRSPSKVVSIHYLRVPLLYLTRDSSSEPK
jgi:hypothetical protein